MIDNEGLRKGEHEALPEELSAYIDGELEGEDAERIRVHLDECPQCRELCERLARLSDDIKNAQPAVPEDLHERIMNAVKGEKGIKKNVVFRFNNALRRYGLWIGAGAVAVICFVLVGAPVFKGGFDMKLNSAAEDAMIVRQDNAEASPEAYDGEMGYFSTYSYSAEAAVELETASCSEYSYDFSEEEKSMISKVQSLPAEGVAETSRSENVTADEMTGSIDDEAASDMIADEAAFPSFFYPRSVLDPNR